MKFDLKELPEVGTFPEACDSLGQMFVNVVVDSYNHVRIWERNVLYGLRQVGSRWVGYQKPYEEGEIPRAGEWDGVWSYDFYATSLPEAVLGLIYLILSDGNRSEFTRTLTEMSFFKPGSG